MPPIRRRQDWALWLDILKVTHNAHCYGESLGYVRTGNKASLSGKNSNFPNIISQSIIITLDIPNNRYIDVLSLNLPCTLFKKAQISYQYKNTSSTLFPVTYRKISTNMIDKKKVVYDRPSKRYYLGWILWSILTLQAFVYLAKVFAYYQVNHSLGKRRAKIGSKTKSTLQH